MKEDKGSNQAIGTIKRTEPTSGLVPGFELVVESLNEVIGNDIVEVFNLNVTNVREEFSSRFYIAVVAVGNDCRGWRTGLVPTAFKQGMSAVGITAR